MSCKALGKENIIPKEEEKLSSRAAEVVPHVITPLREWGFVGCSEQPCGFGVRGALLDMKEQK